MQHKITPAGRRPRRALIASALTLAFGSAGAHAAGPTWQSATVSDTTRSATLPAAAIDSAGNISAAWLQRDGTVSRVAVSTRPTGSYAWQSSTPPSYISKSGEDVADLAFAGNAKGDAIAVWRVGGSIKVAYRFGISGDWSAQSTLRSAAGTVGPMSVSLDDERGAVVAWTEGASVWVTYRTTSRTFATPAKLNTVTTTRVEHVFTGMDALGGHYVAWDQLQSGAKGTYMGVYLAKRSKGATAWIRSGRTDLGFDTRATSLAVRGNGAALMGTQQRNNLSAKAFLVPYTTTPTGITVEAARQFGSNSVATSGAVTAMNSKGDGVVAYLSTTNQSTYELRLSYYLRQTNTWTTPQTVSTGPKPQGIAVAISFTGVGVATWSESASGSQRVRFTQRQSLDDAWQPPATLDSGTSTTAGTVLTERGGHFVAAWTDSTSGRTTGDVGILDTVAPKVSAGFRLVLPVRSPVSMTMRTIDAGSPIARYDWTFWDDSPPATGRTVSHTFRRLGTFRVTLKATDAAGNITRTQVFVKTVNFAAVGGFPVVGSRLVCKSSIPGASISWKRGSTALRSRRRHTVTAADLGKKVSCTARTSKQAATSPGRLVPLRCRIPAVLGMPSGAAGVAVRNRGCRVTVTTAAAAPAKVGRVIATSHPAGRRVPNGTVVRLTVGR